MALIKFKNLPDTTTAVNAENLDNNFTYTNPVGAIIQYAGSTAPIGYLICDGSAISRETYSSLFEIIGITYGSGDGSTTFNLPNYKGRVGVGLDSNDSDFDTLGETLGEKEHTLTINEMPSHQHEIAYAKPNTADTYGNGYVYGEKDSTNTLMITASGGSQPHNIIQPSIVTNYIIKY